MNSVAKPQRRTRKMLRALGFATLVFVTLAALAYGAINLWGRLEWNRTKKELLAKGEPLSASELVLPKVSDERNFYGTKSWKGLPWKAEEEQISRPEEYDRRDPFGVLFWREADGRRQSLAALAKTGNFYFQGGRLTDLEGFARLFRDNKIAQDGGGSSAATVLSGLERVAPLFAEIEEGSMRPEARAPYDIDWTMLHEVRIPHIGPFLALAQNLRLRAIAQAAEGQPPAAAADILLILRLSAVLRPDPFFISKLVQRACIVLSIHTFWECNILASWNDDELEKIQQAFAACHPAEDVMAGLRWERGVTNEWFGRRPSRKEFIDLFRIMEGMTDSNPQKVSELGFRFYPEGFLLADQAALNRSLQREIEIVKDNDISGAKELELSKGPQPFWLHPYANFVFSNLKGEPIRAMNVQIQLNLAQVACALERYRLANGAFLASLETLVPDFLVAIPCDPITHKSIGYRLASPDNYVLTCTAIKSVSKNANPPDDIWTWKRLLPRPSAGER